MLLAELARWMNSAELTPLFKFADDALIILFMWIYHQTSSWKRDQSDASLKHNLWVACALKETIQAVSSKVKIFSREENNLRSGSSEWGRGII